MNISKFFIATFLSLAVIMQVKAQICCQKNGNIQVLALNTDFKAAHDAPEPFVYTPESTSKMISFATPDGKQGSAFYIPSSAASNKVLIVFHEWWGLNDYIKREAERLHNSIGDVAVYAIDLYDGVVASDPNTAGKLMSELKAERANAIIKGLLNQIGADKKVATIGWCMGGSWSFSGTIAAGKQSVGCVMYYGFPETDKKVIGKLNTDVLYIRGTEDKFIDAKSVIDFGKQVKAAGHHFTQKDFKADHAFANPSNPHFDATSADGAMKLSLAFLKKAFGL